MLGFGFTGSPSGGASGIGGYPRVNTYTDLPLPTSAPNRIYLVLTSSEVYLINRKEAGVYYSNGIAWRRLGDIPSFFNDSNFQVYNNTDNTKQVAFDASQISPSTTRTLTIPDKNGTIALMDDTRRTPVSVKTGNYTANVNDLIPCDISGGSFIITLPSAPVDKAKIEIQLVKIAQSTNLQIMAGGTDKFWRTDGPGSFYLSLNLDNASLQYSAAIGVWYVELGSATYNFATNFPGIDATAPLTEADITIDTTTRILTINPALGYFRFIVDGGGKVNRFVKLGATSFPAFTDTSGTWFFYYDSTGAAITTQVPWRTSDFQNIATIYRIVWNASLSGSAKLVAQYVEYHLNTISAADHQHYHLGGSIWMNGFAMVNNAITLGAPNADGRNTVVALTTGSNVDDNLDYTVTNSTSAAAWNQDLGNITAASLNATNSALFKIFIQNGSGLISFISASRFPFPFNVSNQPEYITSTGVRTAVTNGNFMVVFIYAIQSPVNGEAIKVITATQDFTTLTNARAYNWVDIQNIYPIFSTDYEIRPLYRLIYEVRNAAPLTYNVEAKYSALRETQDIRKSAVTSTTAATGSIAASSVTFMPPVGMTSTNVQSALEEIWAALP